LGTPPEERGEHNMTGGREPILHLNEACPKLGLGQSQRRAGDGKGTEEGGS